MAIKKKINHASVFCFCILKWGLQTTYNDGSDIDENRQVEHHVNDVLKMCLFGFFTKPVIPGECIACSKTCQDIITSRKARHAHQKKLHADSLLISLLSMYICKQTSSGVATHTLSKKKTLTARAIAKDRKEGLSMRWLACRHMMISSPRRNGFCLLWSLTAAQTTAAFYVQRNRQPRR